jgi:hypothetical protein
MSTLRGISMVAGLCLAGAALAQAPSMSSQSERMSDQTNSAASTPEQPMPPSQAGPAASTPDQANSATYPSTPDTGSPDTGSGMSPQQSATPAQTSSDAGPTHSADPNAGAISHQKGSMRTASADPNAGITPGMDVTARTGEAVGTVVDVVRNASGEPAYVVIADQSGSDTAVPFAIARHMVKGNKVVVDAKRLQDAPKVPESQLQNGASTAWQDKADSYWGKKAASSKKASG